MASKRNPNRKTLSKKIRAEVLAKTNGNCAYCGDPIGRLYVDHIVPIDHGGTNDISNLHASCFSCNSFKHAFTLEQFRKEMEAQIGRAWDYSRNFRMAVKYGLAEMHESKIEFYFERLQRQLALKKEREEKGLKKFTVETEDNELSGSQIYSCWAKDKEEALSIFKNGDGEFVDESYEFMSGNFELRNIDEVEDE